MRVFRSIFIISTLVFTVSCGKSGKPDSVEMTTKVEHIDVNIDNPKDILYVPTSREKKELGAPESANTFIASGNGGLGDAASFRNGIDSLTPYAGIPIELPSANFNKRNVIVNSSGDAACSKMFNFNNDTNNPLILIDSSKVTKLTICQVEVTITVVQDNLPPLTAQKSFEVAVNLTLGGYIAAKDKFIDYIKESAKISSVDDLLKWINIFPKNRLDVAEEDSGNLINTDQILATSVFYLYRDITKSCGDTFAKTCLDNLDAITSLQNIQLLDLRGSQVQDIRGLRYLKNLQELDLSNTRVSQESIAALSVLPNLKKLVVRNLSLKDIKYITENLKNLQYLDISSNDQLYDLNSIEKLGKLTTLIASNIGLTPKGFRDLVNFSQIKTLDLSKNNLSFLKANSADLNADDDAKKMWYLFNLEELNLSNTKISDAVLDKYFELVATHQNNLVKFVDRNIFDSTPRENCSGVINRFSDSTGVSKIRLLSSLKVLNIQGNSCLLKDSKGNVTPVGTTDLKFISTPTDLTNLTHLDISNNAISHLDALKRLNNLDPNELKIDNLGTPGNPISILACQNQLAGSSFINLCKAPLFPSPATIIYEFATNSTNFTIPFDGYIDIVGCTAGDGGGGGQGGQGGISATTDFYLNDEPNWKTFGDPKSNNGRPKKYNLLPLDYRPDNSVNSLSRSAQPFSTVINTSTESQAYLVNFTTDTSNGITKQTNIPAPNLKSTVCTHLLRASIQPLFYENNQVLFSL